MFVKEALDLTDTNVVITNAKSASEKVYLKDYVGVDDKTELDAGTLQHVELLDANDGNGPYFIKDNRVMVQLYGINQWLVIDPGVAVTLTVAASEEAAYYSSLATADLTVVLS